MAGRFFDDVILEKSGLLVSHQAKENRRGRWGARRVGISGVLPENIRSVLDRGDDRGILFVVMMPGWRVGGIHHGEDDSDEHGGGDELEHAVIFHGDGTLVTGLDGSARNRFRPPAE